MRPYRGKRRDNGEWVYGSLQWLENKYRDAPGIEAKILQPTEYNHMTNFDPHRDKNKDFKRDWIIYDVIPETVGQQIGIQDRDDHEIYQGDVLEDGPVDEPCTVVYKQVNARYEAHGIRHTLRAHKFHLCKITGTMHDREVE